jgi:[acyl-carrier-protein] S-malonyltransferase
MGVRKAVRLPVSVPSHTPLMRGAAEQLAARMDAMSWQLPGIPVVQNADVRSFDTVDEIRAALARQLYQPVQWTGCVQALRERGATRLAECGPGKVLAGLVKRIDKTLECRSLGTPADFDAALADWPR